MAWSMTSSSYWIASLLALTATLNPYGSTKNGRRVVADDSGLFDGGGTLCSLCPYEAVEPHMGTLFRIKLFAPDEATAQNAFRAAFARVAKLDGILSDYQPPSELSRITQQAVGHPVRVSNDLFTVATAAQELSVATAGAFDLTVGPLTHLWRDARHQHTLPQPEAVQSAMARCGYQKLHLQADRTMEFDQAGMLLDAGGIAKGYAADEALAVLEAMGLHSALVAASGDLAFGDAPPGSSGWRVGIDSFDSVQKPFTQVLMLSNAAVSTSGRSEQNLQAGDRTYSHIIDPRTGMGLTDDLTVTTIARRGLQADPAATAISVMGCKRGMKYANRAGLAVFILEKRDGHVKSMESDRFTELMHNDR
jgi:thiamine biosynthesis lipoprotein